MSLGISTLIVLALFVLVIFQRVTDGNKPAVIHARALLDHVRQIHNDYYVPVEVINKGIMTAEAVRISGTMGSESRDFEIDFLDGDEKAQGILIFHSDPRTTPLTIEVLSFREP